MREEPLVTGSDFKGAETEEQETRQKSVSGHSFFLAIKVLAIKNYLFMFFIVKLKLLTESVTIS